MQENIILDYTRSSHHMNLICKDKSPRLREDPLPVYDLLSQEQCEPALRFRTRSNLSKNNH